MRALPPVVPLDIGAAPIPRPVPTALAVVGPIEERRLSRLLLAKVVKVVRLVVLDTRLAVATPLARRRISGRQ